MPIDWDMLDSELNDAIDTAADTTDEALASKISSITKLTNREIQELFPSPADVKTLTELMTIVKSADDRNTKVNRIVANAERFGSVVVTLLDKVV